MTSLDMSPLAATHAMAALPADIAPSGPFGLDETTGMLVVVGIVVVVVAAVAGLIVLAVKRGRK